jgi:AcrR family transcriptional regulator
MKTTETVKSELGLRERKRATTRAALERIAIDLALEQGYERATVEAICTAGMVSRRTFFNYFGTKEGAFLGPPTPDPDEQTTDAFVHRGSDNIVTDLARTMTATALDHEVDNDLILKRSRLIQATPELWEAMMARMRDSEDLFVALVLRRFAADGRSKDSSNDEAEARMIVTLGMGVVQFMMREWQESGLEISLSEVRDHAIALMERALSPMHLATTVEQDILPESLDGDGGDGGFFSRC